MSEKDYPDNVLFRWYERYIGEPETETGVYLGFGIFFAAVALAVIGILLFLGVTGVYGFRTTEYFALAEPAYLFGMLSLPFALLAIVILLPTVSRVRWLGGLGTAITLLAALGFLWYYPNEWFEFGTQATLLVIGTYSVGVAILTAATGSALVAHRINRVRPPTPSEIEAVEEPAEEEFTDEQIRSDIEEAMASVDITWGGIEPEEHRSLTFTPDFADEAREEIDMEANRVVTEGGVDTQVQQLKALKGGTKKTARVETTVDAQTDALNRLKEQKRKDEVPTDAPVASGGLFGRLLSQLGLR